MKLVSRNLVRYDLEGLSLQVDICAKFSRRKLFHPDLTQHT